MPDTRRIRLTALLAAALLPAALLFAGPASATTIVYDFASDDGGFTAGGTSGAGQPWTWNATDGQWEVPQASGGPDGQSTLLSPTVTAGGPTLTLSFEHEYDFDQDQSGLGGTGQLRMSINQGSYGNASDDVGTFTTGTHGYNDSTVDGISHWGGSFGPGTSTVEFTGLDVDDELRFMWLATWDNVDVDFDPTWYITEVRIDGVAASAPIPEPATLTLLGLGVAGLAARRMRRK
jgi:hypothetical protein